MVIVRGKKTMYVAVAVSFIKSKKIMKSAF